MPPDGYPSGGILYLAKKRRFLQVLLVRHWEYAR